MIVCTFINTFIVLFIFINIFIFDYRALILKREVVLLIDH